MLNISISTPKTKIKSLALGRFDGLHRGHLELFAHLDKESSALFIINKFGDSYLCTNEDKARLLPFSLCFADFEELKDLNGEEFLNELGKNFPKLEKIVVGEDFRFGKDRKYSAFDIENLSNFETIIVKEFIYKGFAVHSKLIKQFLSEGKIELANELLARIYFVQGELVKGQGLGSKELFPTLNIDTKGLYFLPQNGVYAGFCEFDEKKYQSVIFIGKRLSTDKNFSIEIHILEPFDEPKTQKIYIYFTHFLRQNCHFANLADLKVQICKDCENALQCLAKGSENER